MRPNFTSAYNNRGIIFLRKLDFPRALDEFNAAIKFGPTSPSRYTHLNNRARAETLLQQYDAALADFSEAQKLNADGPQVPSNRCIAYTEMKRFDEAIADCNAALAKTPKNVFVLTNRANAYLGRPRRCVGRLQRGDQDRSEQHTGACRARAVFREEG